ncbi:alpha-N-acetylgalactosamine-specific lectin-like [Patiria miniata]|uniref:C-type lectin domain-containing protein n=1 Tax=Patiria miniata TaxID=46514 RepID=A0A914AQE2_PATMI|nr:alpha-N-acetylgalactosamine-specific lectin-like [Patiria miniata]
MAFMRVLWCVVLVSFAPVCQQAECPKCPPMWTFYNGYCYRLFGNAKTFSEAENHCQDFTNVGQGHLTSIANAQENNLLFTVWKSTRGTAEGGLWIGFTDEVEEGNFIWTDKSVVNFTEWSDGQPDNYGGGEKCTHMWYGKYGEWNDIGCDNLFSYMCKMTAFL